MRANYDDAPSIRPLSVAISKDIILILLKARGRWCWRWGWEEWLECSRNPPAVVGLSFLGEFFSHVLRGEVSVKYNPLHCNTFYTKTKEMRGIGIPSHCCLFLEKGLCAQRRFDFVSSMIEFVHRPQNP